MSMSMSMSMFTICYISSKTEDFIIDKMFTSIVFFASIVLFWSALGSRSKNLDQNYLVKWNTEEAKRQIR